MLRPPSGKASACCGGGSPSKTVLRYEDTFVDGQVETPAGPVPRVHSRIGNRDLLGRWKVRWGIGRDSYRVAPGLYALGAPDGNAPVLVTANYKLTFDVVRRDGAGLDAWILVLDTRGINVWCAAGEGTFGTEEVIRRVTEARLAEGGESPPAHPSAARCAGSRRPRGPEGVRLLGGVRTGARPGHPFVPRVRG